MKNKTRRYLTKTQAREVRAMKRTGKTYAQIMRKFKVSSGTVYNVVSGNWSGG